MATEIRFADLAGLLLVPGGEEAVFEADGRSVRFSSLTSAEWPLVAAAWQSPNDLLVELLIGFPTDLGFMNVDVDEENIVLGVESTLEIEHERLRSEVEWAIDVIKAAAAEGRASGVETDPEALKRAHMRSLLDSL